MMHRLVLSLTVVVLVCWMSACTSSGVNRSELLAHTADELIMPAYSDFTVKTEALDGAMMRFTENPDESSLGLVRNAWKEAILSWKRAELYNFGPVEEQVLVTSIDRWPTSGPGIEDAVETYDGSEDYLVRIGSNRKGLPALEYLLFHDEAELVIHEFQDSQRQAYTQSLTNALVMHARTIQESWEEEYRESFVQATGNRSDSGVTLLANELGYLLEMVRMDKIEIPFGSQTNGTPRLHMLESPYAGISRELIRENLRQARKTFHGGQGLGFDDYLNILGIEHKDGESLTETINAEYERALMILDSMDRPLHEVIEQDRLRVESLVGSLQRLYILTEVDMISRLHILDTFSDNDGD